MREPFKLYDRNWILTTAEFFVNFLSHEQKMTIDGKEFTIAPLSVLVQEEIRKG